LTDVQLGTHSQRHKLGSPIWPWKASPPDLQSEMFAHLTAVPASASSALTVPLELTLAGELLPLYRQRSEWSQGEGKKWGDRVALLDAAPLAPLSVLPFVAVLTPNEARDFYLGGDADSKYHLKVKLTTKGAGVRMITLNKFQAAD